MAVHLRVVILKKGHGIITLEGTLGPVFKKFVSKIQMYDLHFSTEERYFFSVHSFLKHYISK